MSDVDRMTDVPRFHVYGATENLEEQGLVEVQQSNPIRYREIEADVRVFGDDESVRAAYGVVVGQFPGETNGDVAGRPTGSRPSGW